MNIQRWDIWLAFVPYEEDDGRYSRRPALVIRQQGNSPYWITFKMTSTPPRANYPGEYRIKQWRDAGLDVATTVRLSKIVRLHEDDFIARFGQLTDTDIDGILALIDAITVARRRADPLALTHRPKGMSEDAWSEFQTIQRLFGGSPGMGGGTSMSETASSATPDAQLERHDLAEDNQYGPGGPQR